MTNPFIIALPSVIAVNLLLGTIVFFTHIRRLANRVFTILSLFIALWLTCQYFGSTTLSEAWLMFWIRQACVASLFMLFFFICCKARWHGQRRRSSTCCGNHGCGL